MCSPQVVHPNSILLFLNTLYIWHYPVFLIFLKGEWWFFFFFLSLIRLPEVDLGIYFIYFQYYVMGGKWWVLGRRIEYHFLQWFISSIYKYLMFVLMFIIHIYLLSLG